MTSGMPASRRASKPEPRASRVVLSRASSRAWSMPNCCDHVERRVPAGQLDDVGRVVDRHERAAPRRVLDEPGDPLVDHPGADALGEDLDERLAGEDPRDVVIVEGLRDTGQPERRTGDDDRLAGVRATRGVGRAARLGQRRRDRAGPHEPHPLGENAREQRAELGDRGIRRGRERSGERPGEGCGRGNGSRRLGRLGRQGRQGRRGGGTGATAGAGAEVADAPRPRPAAYRPHRAWLNAAASPTLGWLV